MAGLGKEPVWNPIQAIANKTICLSNSEYGRWTPLGFSRYHWDVAHTDHQLPAISTHLCSCNVEWALHKLTSLCFHVFYVFPSISDLQAILWFKTITDLAAQTADKGFSVFCRKRACVASLPLYCLCHSGFREVAHGEVLESIGLLALHSSPTPQFTASVSMQTSRKRYQPLYSVFLE